MQQSQLEASLRQAMELLKKLIYKQQLTEQKLAAANQALLGKNQG